MAGLTEADIINQDHGASPHNVIDRYPTLPVRLGQDEVIYAPLKSIASSVNQLRESSSFEPVERDEVSHSYIIMPDTSLPFLGPENISAAARTTLAPGVEINFGNSSTVHHFEPTSTHPYGQHRMFKFFDATHLIEVMKASHAGHTQSLATSLVVEYSEEQFVIATNESTIEPLVTMASVSGKTGINASCIPSKVRPDIQALLPAAMYKQMDGLEKMSVRGWPAPDLAGIGAQFEEHVEWEDARLALEELQTVAAAIAQ